MVGSKSSWPLQCTRTVPRLSQGPPPTQSPHRWPGWPRWFSSVSHVGGGGKTSAGGALSSGYSPPRRPTYRSIAPARTQQDRETEEQTPKHGTPSWFYFWADIQNPGAGSKTWLATRLFGHCQVQGPHQVSWKGGILIHSPPSQPKCQLFWQHKDFL